MRAIFSLLLGVASIGVIFTMPTAWQHPILYVVPIVFFGLTIENVLSK